MISGLETIIAAFIAGAVTIIGLYAKARRDGAKAEQAKAHEQRIRDMQIVDDIDHAVAGNDPAKNREELAKWQRR